MKTLAVVAVSLTLVGAAPRQAAAQEAGSVATAVAVTLAGAALGGAVGYYYFTGPIATAVGIIAGGAIGEWWYTTKASSGASGGRMKMRHAGTSQPLFRLIDHTGVTRAGLHTAAFSAAAD